MLKRFYIVSFLIITSMFINVGCSSENSNNNKIAYISSNPNSQYQKTFEELNLGVLFDFNLKLTQADKSWVNIWVEGYSNGKAIEPFPLSQLSYGITPEKVVEGHMGFGIINPNSVDPQPFLYSSEVKMPPHSIENNFFIEAGVTSWEYAIGNKTIGLESGEERILAVYRQAEDSFRSSYDYQDLDSVNKMIEEDKTVLLLKIKVEEKNEL